MQQNKNCISQNVNAVCTGETLTYMNRGDMKIATKDDKPKFQGNLHKWLFP